MGKKPRRKQRPVPPPGEARSLPRWQVVLLVLFGLAVLALTIGIAVSEMQRLAEEDQSPVGGP